MIKESTFTVISAKEGEAFENWHGTLGKVVRIATEAKTEKLALAYAKRVSREWPGDWVIFPIPHYKTGECVGFGVSAR